MSNDTVTAGELLIRIDERTAGMAKRVETIESKLDGVVYRREIEAFMPRTEIMAADKTLADRIDRLERWLTWGAMGLITTFGGMVANLFHLKLSG